jgi:type I restriction enzyme S subunit
MILAHTVPLAMTTVDCTINQDMKAIRFLDEITPEFGLFCLKAQHKALLDRVDTAAHGTKRLDMAALGGVPILLPEKAAQEQFLTALKQAASLRDRQGIQNKRQKALFASLQHRAFQGELLAAERPAPPVTDLTS